MKVQFCGELSCLFYAGATTAGGLKMKEVLKSALPNSVLEIGRRVLAPYQDWKALNSLEKYLQNRYIAFSEISEEDYPNRISELYKQRTGNILNWDNPLRYTEKVQWRKLYDQKPIYTTLSDKYLVREWVEKRIGREYLIPLLGVWNDFRKIKFRKLPHQFVLKTNHASGTTIIVRNNEDMHYHSLQHKMNIWMKYPYSMMGFEMHYQGIHPLIIAEQFIESENTESVPRDYKFMCFNGCPEFCWVDSDRYTGHKRNVYNLNWELQSWTINENYAHTNQSLQKPKNFDLMVNIAKELSKDFSHVRIDLYNNNGKIYFGEMTFTSGSGFEKFMPDVFDFKIGKLWNIQK